MRAARGGDALAQERFARQYMPVVKAYLAERWRGGALAEEIDDAHQEVFVECFRGGGALERFEEAERRGFRPFLFAVVRNVARRLEERRAARSELAPSVLLDELEFDAQGVSTMFDRAWAFSLLREAAQIQRLRAAELGAEALRRVELLELRLTQDLPIREIATRWNEPPERVHREYARAREEFRAALVEALAFHQPDPRSAEQECQRLLAVISS